MRTYGNKVKDHVPWGQTSRNKLSITFALKWNYVFFRFEKGIEKVFMLENIGFIGHNNLSNFRIEIVKINDDFEIEKW